MFLEPLNNLTGFKCSIFYKHDTISTMQKAFKDLLKNSCTLYADKIFLRDMSSGASFTFKEFFDAARHISSYLSSNHSDKKIIVLTSSNNYLFGVYIVATILAGKKLLLINPDETLPSFQKILGQLKESYFIFSDRDIGPVLTHGCFSFQKNHPCPDDYEPIGTEINQDLIYIPTSATTGESKVVIQKENSILLNVQTLIKHHQLRPGNKIATPLPLFHVNALHFSFFCSLFSGGTLTLFHHFDLKKTFEIIESEKIEILSIIPSILSNIIRNFEQIKFHNLDSLKYFVSAAAPLSSDIVKKIDQLLNKKIIQGYGLSESVNFSCKIPISIDQELYYKIMVNERFPSVGIALECNEVIIKNGSTLITRDNIEGEIHIGGPCLMHSYLNTPSEHFFSDGYLKTGDLGYYKTFNGVKYFFISGRIKETAKVNGHTVSLRELDDQIHSKFNLKNDIITTSFENEFRGEEIALICKIEECDEIDFILKSIMEALSAIDTYFKPRVIVFSESIPLRTASGKAKRWIFKKNLTKFKDYRFLNSVETIKI